MNRMAEIRRLQSLLTWNGSRSRGVSKCIQILACVSCVGRLLISAVLMCNFHVCTYFMFVCNVNTTPPLRPLQPAGPGGIAPLHLVALLGQPYILTGLQFVVPEVREMWYTLRDSTCLTPSELRTMTQLPPSYVRPCDLPSPSVIGDSRALPASDGRTQHLPVVHEGSASPTLTPLQLLSAGRSLGANNAVSGQGRDAMFTPLPSPSVSCNSPVATAVVPLSHPPSPLEDGPTSSLPSFSCPDWGKLPTVIACRDAKDNLRESEITERLSASREKSQYEMVEDAVADVARLSLSMNPSPTSDLPGGGMASESLRLGIGAPSALPPPQQQHQAADGGRANKGGVSILSCLAMNFTRR